MTDLLRTRRWIGFTLLVAGSIIAFGLLSLWQFARAEEKRAQRIDLQSAVETAAHPWAEVAGTSGSVDPRVEWSSVTLTGQYDGSSQVVVRKRPLDTRNGFWVLTPLATETGPVVWVNRGWIPTSGDALATPVIPDPPAGPVTVTGYLRLFEQVGADANDGLPPGQIAAVSPTTLPDQGAAPEGYVQLATSDPAQSEVVTLPLPTVDEGRNISYAIQWLLFAAVAISGWWYFLRREAAEDARQHDAPLPLDAATSAEQPWT